ncbi:MAG: hypothetical protein IT452_24130 [Planctomycetia bacterium]|nr:hypothetical protein [Planctomycetia bacterium]
MPFNDSRLSRTTAALALGAALAFPALLAAWILLGPEEEELAGGRVLEPDVFDAELERYDWAVIGEGDWVEHEVATASRLDVSLRVRTRLACVGVEGATAWVEGRDHLVARFFPGTTVLYEVRRDSGRITRAWWAREGRPVRPVLVRRVVTPPVPPSGYRRRARTEGSVLDAGGAVLECVKALVQESADGRDWSTRSTVWLSPEVPFPRGVSMAAPGEEFAWEGKAARGGVVREEYSGMAVRMTTELAAWGRDARRTVWPPAEGPPSR